MSQPVIKIENLVQYYQSTEPVLKGINLNIYPGQIIGYIGPNGAGKTTTVKVLTGMLNQFLGYVEVLGHDISKEPLEVKRKIGYVPENAALYDTLTPIEYLSFIAGVYELDSKISEKKINEFLDCFELTGVKNNRMTTFSKGMRQKVLIISAFLHNPEVIFLDEPLSGLDANTTILVKEILDKLAKDGKTIFYCSHIMDVVERISDRIVIINNGKIIADAPFEELKSMNNQKGNENESLENIFSQLTGNGEQINKAEQFLNILKG